jgi:hypothetical protein
MYIFNGSNANEQVIRMKEKKSITYTWKVLKILIFMSFIYTAAVMFRLKNMNTAINIIFAVSFFLVFNRIDSINKKLKELEVK